MIVALTLLAGALAVGWLVPHVLRRMDLRRCDPVLLIVAWLVSIGGVLFAAATGVVMLLLPDHGPSATLLAAIHECWSTIRHGSPPRVEEITGLFGLALLAAFAVRLAVVCLRGVRRRSRKRQENLEVLQLVARSTADPSEVLWLAHDRPMAFSMAGRPGVVVATDGLAKHLAPAAVAAVLAHERAHLAGRHHLLVAAADAVCATFPFIPLFRQAPRAIRDLIELAADVAAVRDCGSAAVRTALLDMVRPSAPSTTLAMAQEAVELRLSRLIHAAPTAGTLRRSVLRGFTGVTAALLPSLTGTAFLLGLAILSCH